MGINETFFQLFFERVAHAHVLTEFMYFQQKNFKTFEQDLQKLGGDLQKLHKNAQHLTITSPTDTFAPRKPTFSQMVKKWLKN